MQFVPEAWIALTTVAMKSIEYCLPATMFTKKECQEIMWILIESFAPKVGINCYIKHDVIYALPREIKYREYNSHTSQVLIYASNIVPTGRLLCVFSHFCRIFFTFDWLMIALPSELSWTRISKEKGSYFISLAHYCNHKDLAWKKIITCKA